MLTFYNSSSGVLPHVRTNLESLMHNPRIAVVGGGLAGCECALYLAQHNIDVTILEQKPLHYSPAHVSSKLAELICSNSLRSDELTTGVGLLKQELRELSSSLMKVADATRVPAGKALAVNRAAFSDRIEHQVRETPNINLIPHIVTGLDDRFIALKNDPSDPSDDGYDRVIIAAGPLAGKALSASIAKAVGAEHLYFYDAIAPIISGDSIDMGTAFWCSRYGEPGTGDYLNCPLDENQYRTFYEALSCAEMAAGHAFEQELHFEGCMPIEALAARGERTLTFGPMKPVGLTDPRTGRRPFAVLQLRPEDSNKTMFNLVGCQTKMTYGAQARVFRLIPGLEHAEFLRYGSMHRNTYVNAPQALDENLALRSHPRIHLAGQITGVEGYVESIACGLWAGMRVRALLSNLPLTPPPPTTALGALMHHLAMPAKNFQPSNVHFGLMPEPSERIRKKERKAWYAQRAREDFAVWRKQLKRIFAAS